MGCHGNQNAFIFEDDIFLHFNGPIEQINMHKKMSYVFNVGLFTPGILDYPMIFPHFSVFINIR